MKNNLKIVILSLFIVAANLFISCDMNKQEIVFTFTSLPYDAKGMTAYIQGIDGGNNYTNYELGQIDSKKCVFSEKISENTVYFYAILVDYYGYVKYYVGVSTKNGLNSDYYIDGYWVDVDEYEYESGDWYATSEDYIEPLDLNKTITVDFDKAPFYIYSISGVKDKKIKFKYDLGEYTDIQITENINKILEHDSFNGEKRFNETVYDIIPKDDILYFIVRPKKYGEWENANATITVCDYTDLINNSLNFNTVNPLSDNEYLVSYKPDTWSDKPNSLYKYNINEKKLTLITEFESTIYNIIPYKNGYLFSVDNNIYLYENSQLTIFYTTDKNIKAFCIADDNLVIYKTNKYVDVVSIVDINSFEEKNQKNIYIDIPTENTMIYVPEKNIVYFLDISYNNPSRLHYISWDNNFTNITVDTCSITRDFKAPLVYFGNNILIDGWGSVCKIKENPKDVELLKYTDKIFDKVVFDDDYLYELKYYDGITKIIKIRIDELDANPIKEIDLKNERGLLLEKKTDGIQVITEQKIDFKADIYNYYMLTSHKLNFNLEEDTTAARNAISSSKKPSYYNKDIKELKIKF